MSKTVGGRSARLTAAASCGAASISSLVSGQAARGWGCTRPGLSPPAILFSLFGSVNDTFLFRCPAGDPEKESHKTVGGRSARLTAAASCGAASISSLVSGQAARGWGCTRPGFSPLAILSSLFGSVNDTFLFRCPAGDPEKESQ